MSVGLRGKLDEAFLFFVTVSASHGCPRLPYEARAASFLTAVVGVYFVVDSSGLGCDRMFARSAKLVGLFGTDCPPPLLR